MKHIMNLLKSKITIHCNTCGCLLSRTKTIKVQASEKAAAISEANQKIQAWQKSLTGQNCKICQSILDSVK
jgi:hypothetical protein